MNFFEHQEHAHRKTSILILYFILAVFLIVIAVNALIVSAIVVVQTQNKPMIPRHEILAWFILVGKYVSPSVIGIILLGTLITLFKLKGGGLALAEMVKARPIEYTSSDFLEKRLVNVVEEMSIAAGVPIPKLFVMDNEPAINAFVAGIKPADTVMVVTKGALDNLTREELQGVIGHEYSHILNSDMLINLRLIAILAGILMIGQAGFNIIRIFSSSRSTSSDSKSNFPVVIIFVGLGLVIIGYIGLFFGRLIKAGVSRQRELLADASSVAYTRNPEGLVNALRRIAQSDKGALLKNNHAEDISHLCFSPSSPVIFFKSLLATHPPLAFRIKQIDPDGIYSSRPLKSAAAEKEQKKAKPQSLENIPGTILGAATVMLEKNAMIESEALRQSIGKLTQANILLAQQLISQIPEPLLDEAHNPKSVGNLLWALVSPHSTEKIKALVSDKTILPKEVSTLINIQQALLQMPKNLYLPLINIALASFKQNPIEERKRIYDTLEKVASIEQQDLFDFLVVALIGKAVEDPSPSSTRTKYSRYEDVLPELTALITLIVQYSQDKENQASFFEKIMTHFTQEKVTMKQGITFDATYVRTLLASLNQLTPLCKERVIYAVIDAIASDDKITLEEAALIRGIAASLDCPVPPIVAN